MQLRFTRMAVLIVGMSLAAGACGQYSISNLRAMKAFKDATGLYKRGDFKGAVAGYQEALDLNPNFSLAGVTYFFLGNSYDQQFKQAKKGDPENDANLPKAVENYQLAIQRIKDTDIDGPKIRKSAYEYLIYAYGKDKLNDSSKAEPVAKQLIAADPNEPTSYQALGKLYEEEGRFDEAEAQFQKAVDVKPNDPTGYLALAGFLNRQGQFEKTMAAFQRRADMEPNNPEAWHTMATYYQDKVFKDVGLRIAKQKEYVLAGLVADDKALALNPDYYEAVAFKNILLRMAAKYENDLTKRKQMMDEADVYRDKALQLQKKQGVAGDTKKGGGGK